MAEWIDRAKDVVRDALLSEVDRLKPLLPDTPATRRNVEAIESRMPPTKMKHVELCDYVNLLWRSVP